MDFKKIDEKGGKDDMESNLTCAKSKKFYKDQKGITLIALVITIVVLLILAGVTINAVFSDSGIIKRAQTAQEKIDKAKRNELYGINEVDKWITENTVPMITFTVQELNGKDKTYKVEKGMTWKQAFEAGYFDDREATERWYEQYGTAEKQRKLGYNNKYAFAAGGYQTDEYIVTDAKCCYIMTYNNRIYCSGSMIQFLEKDGSIYRCRMIDWYYLIPEGATQSASSQVMPDDVITPDGKYIIYNAD